MPRHFPHAWALAGAFLLLPAPAHADRGAVSGSDAPRSASTAMPRPPPRPPASAVVSGEVVSPRYRAVQTQPDTGLPLPGARFSARALHQPGTRIGSGLGDYEATRLTLEGRWARNLSSRLQLTLDGTLERGTYDVEDPVALVPTGTGSLAGAYSGWRLAVGGSAALSRSFGFTLGGSLRAMWMDGADMEDGLQPGAVAAVRFRLGGGGSVSVGLAYTQGLEGSPYLLPVFGLGGSMRPEGSRWRVEARGPGASLIYEVTPRFTVGVFGGYERRDIRLADDDRVPGGVLRERRLPVGLEVAWQPKRDAAFVLSAGVSAWNRLSFLDSGGEVVIANDTDPAPFVQLEWTMRW